MKKAIPILFIALMCLLSVSCELNYSYTKPSIYLIAVGNDYEDKVEITKYVDEYGVLNEGLYYGHNLAETGIALELEKTVKDAQDVSDAFSAVAAKAGYKYKQYLITGKNDCTIEKFKTTIEEIKEEIKDTDILICTYSGHGDVFNCSLGNRYYMVFTDAIVSYDYFKILVNSVSKGQKLIICDSCRSGALIPIENGVVINTDTSGEKNAFTLFGTSVSESGTLFIMTASTRNEYSYEGDENGIFTSFLLNGLGWDSRNRKLGEIKAMKNNKLTVAGLAKYIYRNDKEEKNNQTPVFSGRSDDLILFKF